MTQSAYANTIVNTMLGWLKGFANWVLKLFDLAGSGGVSPLGWLSDNWLNLLIFLIVVGVIVDWVVWMLRWRPYWVWFRRKRILIEDDDFFAGEELVDSGLYDRKIFGREIEEPRRPARKRSPEKRAADEDDAWEEEFVVASTVVRRNTQDQADLYSREANEGASRPRRRKSTDDEDWDRDETLKKRVRENRESSAGRRSRDEAAGKRRLEDGEARRSRMDREEGRKKKTRSAQTVRGAKNAAKSAQKPEEDVVDPFAVEQNDPSASSFWEDDVFNVENLPGADDPSAYKPAGSAESDADPDDELL